MSWKLGILSRWTRRVSISVRIAVDPASMEATQGKDSVSKKVRLPSRVRRVIVLSISARIIGMLQSQHAHFVAGKIFPRRSCATKVLLEARSLSIPSWQSQSWLCWCNLARASCGSFVSHQRGRKNLVYHLQIFQFEVVLS